MPDAPDPPPADDPPPFSELERRADGLLFTLFLAVAVVLAVLAYAPGSRARNFTTLGGGVVVGAVAGLWVGRAAGRGYPGGMFLYAPLRVALVLLTLAGLVVGSIQAAAPGFLAR